MRPRILCLGCNRESARALCGLLSEDANVVAVGALPPTAASNTSDYCNLADIAAASELPCLPVTDANAPSWLDALEIHGIDCMFVLGWSQILTAETIVRFPVGVFGSHPSPLPEGRGRAPVPWTILEGRDSSAVTLFRMQPGVDDGPIVAQRNFPLPKRVTATELYELVSENLSAAFIALARQLETGMVAECLQDRSRASWRAGRSPRDGRIDFGAPAEAVDRLVRAITRPFPGAYSYFRDQKVIFWSSFPADGEALRRKGVIGQVLARSDTSVLVQCGDVPLWLSAPATESGETLRVPLGERFGYPIEDILHEMSQRIRALEKIVQGLYGKQT